MGIYAIAQAGDPDALALLVRQHIPLVQALAGRFSFCEDAFQQGCMGLVRAIRGFREEMGRQFSSYAVPGFWEKCAEVSPIRWAGGRGPA